MTLASSSELVLRGLSLPEEEAQLVLDELVHEAAAALAARINNGGVDSQIGFLREQGWLDSDIRSNLETVEV